MKAVEGPFVGNMTFYHFNMIVSGVCTFITCVLIFSLMAEHACRCSVPNEQVKIMRIVHMLPAFSVTSYLAIVYPNSYVYLEGWTEVFQAIALYAFHMLLIDFIAPTERKRDEFFEKLEVKKLFRKGQYREGISWLKLSYYSTLQYPIVVFWVAVFQCIAAAFDRYCLESNKPAFAHLWLQIIQEVSVTIAINAVIRFYANTKEYMKEHKPLMKLLSFKLMVAFMILESSNVFKETSKLSYADVHMGIPTMVICVQMVPFAIFMRHAFSTKAYRIKTSPSDSEEKLAEVNGHGRLVPRSYQGGPFGIHAWLAYYNPVEPFQEVKSMYRTLNHIHVRKQKRICKEEVEGESEQASVEESQSEPEQTGRLQNPSGQSGYGHYEPFEQVQLAQSEPLINQVQYPAQSHYVQDGFEHAQGSVGGNAHWGQDREYGRPHY
ncbi:hypothetical protein N7486_007175 [Penicillium sp. IBT 16267x]|nr:hypothetical protein N7486_007175 [Penicillium sp. IBT 16267x]